MSDFEQISVSFKSEAMRDFMACFTEHGEDIPVQALTQQERATVLLTACRYLVDYCLEPRPPMDDMDRDGALPDENGDYEGRYDLEAKSLLDDISARFTGYEIQVVVPMDLNGMTLALLVPSTQSAMDQLIHVLTHGLF